MQPPNFAPSRAKPRATAVATYLLLVSCAVLQSHVLADATNAPAIPPHDGISPSGLPAVPGLLARLQDDNGDDGGGGGYAPAFDYFDRSLLGRQEPEEPPILELKNNNKTDGEIIPGRTDYFVFKRGRSRLVRSDIEALEAQDARGVVNVSGDLIEDDATAEAGGGDEVNGLSRRQAGNRNRVWISANACRQPARVGTEASENHPKLVMFVSTTNERPGLTDTTIEFDQGYASFDVNTTSDVHVAISSPILDKEWTGSWSYDVAASVDGPYHSYNATDPFLYMIDTDSESALFITYNLTDANTTDSQNWTANNPFSMYAFEVGDQSAITGMERSLCALKGVFGNSSLSTATSITRKFGGDLPKSQFHIQNLTNGTTYNGFLTVQGGNDVVRLPGGGTVRKGGMVFQNFTFTTKSGTST